MTHQDLPQSLGCHVDTQSTSHRMVRTIVLSALIGMLSWGLGGVGWTAEEDRSKLTILSPSEGTVIKGDSVEVRYRLTNIPQATHIHCYVDGEYQKGFKGVVKGLTRGSHEIKIVAANHEHQGLVTQAAVTIEVE